MDELKKIQDFVSEKITEAHREADKYEKLSDNWMGAMSRITPLVEVYHYAGDMMKNSATKEEE